MAFLSLLDDRAKPKGSRDPLGFELVWSHFGRRIIGNLTTVTSSLTNFTVALLGFKWANEIHSGLSRVERSRHVRETFLSFEQIAAYLRYLGDDKEIMGITRVSRRVDDPGVRLHLGMGAEAMILSDQVNYGLWGLYSTAMRETGLVTGENRQLTPLGESIAALIEAKLDKVALIDLVTSKAASRSILQSQVKSFRAALHSKRMRDMLLHAFMNGRSQDGVQPELWRVTQEIAEQNIGFADVPSYLRLVKERTRYTELVKRLEDIEAVERVLVASNNIFNYLRRKDGESISTVLETLTGRYNYAHLNQKLAFSDIPHGDRLRTIRAALLEDDHAGVIRNILELNESVMEHRGGAPWVELESNKSLRVRIPSEKAELLSQAVLQQHWDYEYFFTSYIRVAGSGLGTKWTAQ